MKTSQSVYDTQIEQSGSAQMEGKYLTFLIEEQLMAVSIESVVQIVGIQEITKVPEFPDYAKGIINLRGTIIPVIDVRLRLKKEEKGYDERTCIIISQVLDEMVGFIVDAVDAVSDIADADIADAPSMSKKSAYVTGVAKHQGKVILIIDPDKIVSGEVLTDMMDKI